MPTYYFTCDECGETQERTLPIRRMKRKVKCSCGRFASRDIAAEQRRTVHCPGNWPRLSKALGVTPGQIGEAREEHRKAGIPLEFARDGRAIVNSPNHQRELVRKMKRLGTPMVDHGAYC